MKSKLSYVSFPYYYRDFVILHSSQTRFDVADVESFHKGSGEVIFSCRAFEDCLKEIDATLNASSSRLRRYYIRFLRLFSRERLLPPEPVDSDEVGTTKSIEFGGWLPAFVPSKVGTHPVFNFRFHAPKGFHFITSESKALRISHLFRLFSMFSAILLNSARFLLAGVPISFIVKFWLSRKLSLRNLKIKPGKDTFVIYPTFMFFCPNHSWMVEIEDMLTLMTPFVSNGSFNPQLDRKHPYVKILRVLMQSKLCKGVLCHLNVTAEGLKKIFSEDQDIIAKIKNIPLGMSVPPRIERKVTSKNRIDLLFMNGWAQDCRATFRRGLLDSLEIFNKISQEFDNVYLTVRSQLPDLDPKYLAILDHPNVTVLEEKIPLARLNALYEQSDVLLFPAVRIAVTTLMQAMAHSLAIVASDGFGIEEYVEHEVNGLVGKGFRGASGWIDEEGFFRENYALSLKANPEVVKNCVDQLRRLVVDESFKVTIQNQARDTLEQRFSMDNWNNEFQPYLQHILGVEPAQFHEIAMTS